MHYKQNNKESKSYVQGLRPFSKTLPRGLRGILKKNGYNYSEIIGKWSNLVGKEISLCSYPKSIKIGKHNSNRVLVLAVNRGDEITVEYKKKEIIDKINSYFGYKLINDVKLKTFNQETKTKEKNIFFKNSTEKYTRKISEIKNKTVRNSLSEFFKVLKDN
tara:strand:+ start:149 stop:631 length:483 start_codon:yes stop_codon:yes gene_type:complete